MIGRWLAAAALLAAVAAAQAGERPAVPESPEGWEVLRYDCGSDLARRDITLFANGTIRLREGPRGEETMTLVDLDPDRLEAFLNRLRQEKGPAWGDLQTVGPTGADVERCRLAVRLPGEPAPHVFDLGRFDSVPIALGRLVRIAEDVGREAERERANAVGLPAGYEPRPGDVLRRGDGTLFRVSGFTSDGKGVELHGVDQPLTVYEPLTEIRFRYVALVSRRDRR